MENHLLGVQWLFNQELPESDLVIYEGYYLKCYNYLLSIFLLDRLGEY